MMLVGFLSLTIARCHECAGCRKQGPYLLLLHVLCIYAVQYSRAGEANSTYKFPSPQQPSVAQPSPAHYSSQAGAGQTWNRTTCPARGM
ncbi:uncharacterized protein BKA78DRAFT_179304 [Phyllosticta capitalensis]|uniref:Secreted protein n=1 Tax=Phyllosticta capitalensis TaxID=121624 RepID=A0ABR1YA61_9PEZI